MRHVREQNKVIPSSRAPYFRLEKAAASHDLYVSAHSLDVGVSAKSTQQPNRRTSLIDRTAPASSRRPQSFTATSTVLRSNQTKMGDDKASSMTKANSHPTTWPSRSPNVTPTYSVTNSLVNGPDAHHQSQPDKQAGAAYTPTTTPTPSNGLTEQHASSSGGATNSTQPQQLSSPVQQSILDRSSLVNSPSNWQPSKSTLVSSPLPTSERDKGGGGGGGDVPKTTTTNNNTKVVGSGGGGGSQPYSTHSTHNDNSKPITTQNSAADGTPCGTFGSTNGINNDASSHKAIPNSSSSTSNTSITNNHHHRGGGGQSIPNSHPGGSSTHTTNSTTYLHGNTHNQHSSSNPNPNNNNSKSNTNSCNNLRTWFYKGSSSSPSMSTVNHTLDTRDTTDGNKEEVIIHVLDEGNNVMRDFVCKRALLLQEMKYFRDYLSEDCSSDDLDISVHCDVTIFRWLMEYIHAIHQHEPPPKMDITVAVSVLISSDFLRMEGLVSESIQYIVQNLQDIVYLPIDLDCINSDLLDKLAETAVDFDVDKIKDKKNKIIGQLFLRKIQTLLTTLPSSAPAVNTTNTCGHSNVTCTLFRCSSCSKLYCPYLRAISMCPKAAMSVDQNGKVVTCHQADTKWNVSTWLVSLRSKGISWKEIYWRIWSMVTEGFCGTCQNFFPICNLHQCLYHSNTTVIYNKDGIPVYACCNTACNLMALTLDHSHPSSTLSGCNSTTSNVGLGSSPLMASSAPSSTNSLNDKIAGCCCRYHVVAEPGSGIQTVDREKLLLVVARHARVLDPHFKIGNGPNTTNGLTSKDESIVTMHYVPNNSNTNDSQNDEIDESSSSCGAHHDEEGGAQLCQHQHHNNHNNSKCNFHCVDDPKMSIQFSVWSKPDEVEEWKIFQSMGTPKTQLTNVKRRKKKEWWNKMSHKNKNRWKSNLQREDDTHRVESLTSVLQKKRRDSSLGLVVLLDTNKLNNERKAASADRGNRRQVGPQGKGYSRPTTTTTLSRPPMR